MTKTEEARAEAFRITRIYTVARENFNFCFYLHKPNTDEELKYVTINRHLRFIRISLWRLTVIELVKLFSEKKSDKHALLFFLSKLKKSGYYSALNFDESIINVWVDTINSQTPIIKKIVTLRDKVFAHSDPEEDSFKDIEVTFSQMSELFKIAETILKKIYLDLFGASLDLRTPISDHEEFKFLKILAKEHRERIEKLRSFKS